MYCFFLFIAVHCLLVCIASCCLLGLACYCVLLIVITIAVGVVGGIFLALAKEVGLEPLKQAN